MYRYNAADDRRRPLVPAKHRLEDDRKLVCCCWAGKNSPKAIELFEATGYCHNSMIPELNGIDSRRRSKDRSPETQL